VSSPFDGPTPGRGALTLPGVVSKPLSFAASGSVTRGRVVLIGWTISETTGAAGATVEVWDGAGTNGQRIARRTLIAGESITDLLPNVRARNGVFVNVAAGAASGELYATEAYS
jgi:hypothetical protein